MVIISFSVWTIEQQSAVLTLNPR